MSRMNALAMPRAGRPEKARVMRDCSEREAGSTAL